MCQIVSGPHQVIFSSHFSLKNDHDKKELTGPQIVLKMEILRSQNFSLRNSEKVFGTLPSTENYDLAYVSILKTFKIVHQKLEFFFECFHLIVVKE